MNDLANIVYNPESGEFTRKGGKKKVGYKFVHLGRFKTFDEAVKARLEAEENLNFHKNHGRC